MKNFKHTVTSWKNGPGTFLPPSLDLTVGYIVATFVVSLFLYIFSLFFTGGKKKIREYVADMTVEPRAF